MSMQERNHRLRKKKLGEILIDAGVITEEQLTNALTLQQGKNKRLGKVLIELGYIDDNQVAETLSRQLSLPMVDCNDYEPIKEILDLVSKETAEGKLVLPIKRRGKELTVAMANPLDWQTIEDLSFETGCRLSVCIASEENLLSAIENLYASDETWEILNELPSYDNVEFVKDADEDSSDVSLQSLYQNSEAPPIVKLVTAVIADAVKSDASDIHIEPREKHVQVRYRIDGALKNIQAYPKQIQDAVISRVKIISNLDITNRRYPQDGRSALRLEKKNVDLRISTLPSIYGEKIVIRLLDPSKGLIPLSQLGIDESILKPLIEIFNQPQGMLLVTGPTGSGKTTTLYSVLQQLRTETKNIITLEDPVEYKLADITQVGINDAIGFTFASALRSVLRQDPDIVMVGEIRDLDTAEIASRAALTGHFVLSTLHTNDTISTISRLIDIGLEPFLVTSAVSGIIAQRLIRKICTECKEEVPLPHDADRYGLPVPDKYYRGKGCAKCNGTGYKGRIGAYELVTMNTKMKQIIAKGYTEDELWEAALESGTTTMFQAAWDKMREGAATIEDIISRIPYPHILLKHAGTSARQSIPNPAPKPEPVIEPESIATPDPAAEPDPTPQAEMIPEATPVKKDRKKALIFDSDEEEIQMIRSALETEGYEVIYSSNGEMVETTKKESPSLIIVNNSHDKLDNLKEIRDDLQFEYTPIICLADTDYKEHEAEGFSVGINEFVYRPVDSEKLLSSIKQIVETL
jgi:type IV pilus assembly protein PilB